MKKQLFVVLSVLWVLFMGAHTYYEQSQDNVHQLVESYEQNYGNDWLYGIDVTDDNYYIYKINMQTEEQDFFAVDRVQNQQKVTVKSVVMDEDDVLYALVSVGEDNLIQQCNFEKGTLEPFLVLPENGITAVYEYLDCNGDVVCVFSGQGTIYYYIMTPTELVFRNSITVQQDCLYYGLVENNQLWAISDVGDYSYVQADGTFVPVFVNDGTQISQNNGNVITLPDGFAIQNLDTGIYYELAYVDNTPIFAEHEELNAMNISTRECIIQGTYLQEEQLVLTATLSEKGVLVPCLISATQNTTITSLQRVFDWQAAALVFARGALLGIVVIFVLVHGFDTRKGISVLLILGMATAAISWVALPAIETLLTEQLIIADDAKVYDSCIMLNEMVIESLDLEAFEQAYSLETLTVEDTAAYYTMVSQASDSYLDLSDEQVYNMRYLYTADLYFYQQGGVYCAAGNLLNVELSHLISPLQYQAILTACQTQTPQLVYYTDFGIEVVAMITPIFGQDGTLLGAVEVPQNLMDQYLEFSLLTASLMRITIGCILVILSVICTIIGVGLRDTTQLGRSAHQISQGDFTAIPVIAGNNEIAKLNCTLAEMLHNLVLRTREMQALRQKYNAFVPDMLLRNKEEYYDAQAGQSRDVSGLTVLVHRQTHGMEEFDFFNKVMAKDIAYLTEQQVYIERMSNFSLKVFAQGNMVDLCVNLLERDGDQAYLSITREQLRVGIIGNETRKAVKVIAEFDNFASKISSIAVDYRIPLLISGEAMLEIPHFHQRYRSRRIAYVWVDSQDKVEVIHEVIYGNRQQVQRKKLDSLATFEQGLEFYRLGDMEQAMRRFLTVYRENPQDYIAKEYIFRCEQRKTQEKSDYYLLSV